MTVIAACVDSDGSVWMGADTASVSRNNGARINALPKMFRSGETIVGASGTCRVHQICQYLVEMPELPDECDVVEWMVREYAQALRSAMKFHGGECKDREGNDEMDGRLLIGLRGQIFTIDSGYAVCAHRSSFSAVGCADQEALAGMFIATKLKPDMHARAVVECGLEAAAEYDINIRPPFEIVCDLHESVARLQAVK